MVSYRISCKSKEANNCAFLLDTDITMGETSSNDRLALPYRNNGMSEIGHVYFPVFSFSSGRPPFWNSIGAKRCLCGTREELNIMFLHVPFAYPGGSSPPAIICAVALPCDAPRSKKTAPHGV